MRCARRAEEGDLKEAGSRGRANKKAWRGGGAKARRRRGMGEGRGEACGCGRRTMRRR